MSFMAGCPEASPFFLTAAIGYQILELRDFSIGNRLTSLSYTNRKCQGYTLLLSKTAAVSWKFGCAACGCYNFTITEVVEHEDEGNENNFEELGIVLKSRTKKRWAICRSSIESRIFPIMRSVTKATNLYVYKKWVQMIITIIMMKMKKKKQHLKNKV